MEGKITGWKDNLKKEFNKITWPGKNKVASETAVVIAVSAVLGIFIAVVDLLMKSGIDLVITRM